jgi:flagellar protein FliS
MAGKSNGKRPIIIARIDQYILRYGAKDGYNSMVMTNPYEQYRQQGVMTASASELVVMLYDGCIKQLRMAGMAIEEKEIERANDSLIRAQEIISELIMSLDFNYELSNQLISIYDFCLHSIAEINTNKDGSMIEPLVEILADLREAWAEVAKATRGNALLVSEE